MGGFRFGGGSSGGGGGASDPTWTRFLLGDATAAHPGGGATVTVNSESGSGWTDISRSASNQRQIAQHSTWSIGLTKQTGGALTWADSFTLECHMIFNQCTDTAADTFAGQMVLPVVANAAAPSTSSHFWWGYGLYSSNGTTVKVGRAFSADSSTNPAFTSQQLKSSGWTNNGRLHTVYTSNLQRGAFIGAAAYRKLDNTPFQMGSMNDQQGFVNGMTHFSASSSDQVFLILHVPGWNASGSYDVLNCQFKLFYHINYLPQNPAP